MLGNSISILLITTFIFASCGSKKCSDKSTNYSDVTVTSHGDCCYKTIEENNNSKNWADQNEEILSFKFNGVKEIFEPSNCGPSSCLTYLSVENISADTLTFNYFFHNNHNSSVSLTEGTIFKLEPNAIRSLGKLENHCDSQTFESISNIEVKDIIRY